MTIQPDSYTPTFPADVRVSKMSVAERKEYVASIRERQRNQEAIRDHFSSILANHESRVANAEREIATAEKRLQDARDRLATIHAEYEKAPAAFDEARRNLDLLRAAQHRATIAPKLARLERLREMLAIQDG